MNRLRKKWKASTCRKLSDYVRRSIFEKPIVTTFRDQSLDDSMTEMMRLRNELNSIGNNFNQAVKKLHTLHQIAEFRGWLNTYEADKITLLNKVDEIKIHIEKVGEKWFAVIKTGHSIHRILNYNENKVKEGVAAFIAAANYPIEAEKLSFSQKLNRLIKQAALNENVTRNSVHVSLNFDPSEQLSKESLQEIADTYMQKIGFGEQPYLVYQHFDAGHPHIHIVSIKVRADGSRIDTQNIGKNQSETARKEIEQSFGLIKAEDTKTKQHFETNSAYAAKVQYGKSESRRAIANVLEAVLNSYKYTSLPELNAVLKQYNLLADRGSETSRVYQHQGLLYRILDEQGNSIGIPIKASLFYNKPTLKYLEARFPDNEVARQAHKPRVKNAIDLALLKQPKSSLDSLVAILEKEGINTVLRQNANEIIYGITYVDHRTKCVFNGSALGKQYSAKGILERCNVSQEQTTQQDFVKQRNGHTEPLRQQSNFNPYAQNSEDDLLETLFQPEHTSGYIPNQFMGKGKKKRKKRRSKSI